MGLHMQYIYKLQNLQSFAFSEIDVTTVVTIIDDAFTTTIAGRTSKMELCVKISSRVIVIEK